MRPDKERLKKRDSAEGVGLERWEKMRERREVGSRESEEDRLEK